MQFFKLSTELITDKNISANEFRIYTYLMSIYNEKQGCSFPSMDKIVEKLGMTKPTVNKSIKKLVELGYMIIEKQKAKIGNFNKYTNFKHLVSVNEENVNSYENKIQLKFLRWKRQLRKKLKRKKSRESHLLYQIGRNQGYKLRFLNTQQNINKKLAQF